LSGRHLRQLLSLPLRRRSLRSPRSDRANARILPVPGRHGRVQMPEAEIGDLIVEVRSATAGVGSFTFKFDHMAELTGRTADQIIAARKAAAA